MYRCTYRCIGVPMTAIPDTYLPNFICYHYAPCYDRSVAQSKSVYSQVWPLYHTRIYRTVTSCYDRACTIESHYRETRIDRIWSVTVLTVTPCYKCNRPDSLLHVTTELVESHYREIRERLLERCRTKLQDAKQEAQSSVCVCVLKKYSKNESNKYSICRTQS